MTRYLVTPERAGERLDQALAALSGQSRRRARALATEGRVWLNQSTARVLSRQVEVGDVVDVIAGSGELAQPVPPPLPLRLLREDAWLLAVDKPYGVTTQPPARRSPGEMTVQELALLQLAAREGQRQDLLLFHRLDRLTTGVLVLARTHDAARALAAAWEGGKVHKRYLALVEGDPGPGERLVDAPVGRDLLVPGRFRVTGRGKQARSRVCRLATTGAFSLCEVQPLSGRTHQVRVHLAHLGTPVAGDTFYGGGDAVPRPFLHAWRLRLPHPRDGAPLELVAPIPADLEAICVTFGLTLPA